VFADATLLLGEPYGRFASFSPTGHVAVYLSRVCADEPTVVRLCRAGEPGVVVSRYHRVGGVDWAAVPLIAYLYAVAHTDDVPVRADAADVRRLRDDYRRVHLRTLVPDARDGGVPAGNWVQLVGAAYDRQLVAFHMATSQAEDEAVVARLNGRENRERFNLLLRNCADFARDLLGAYLPGRLRNNVIADLALSTPKQLARSIVRQSTRVDGRPVTGFLVAQVPGSRPLSGQARGVLEGVIKTKKYAIPLAVVQPLVPTGLAVAYLATGRFDPRRHASAALDLSSIAQFAVATPRDTGAATPGDDAH
jgi:hypothetical protein